MKIFLLCLLFSTQVFAFKFTPMSVSISANEGDRHTIVYLENDSSSPIAIQMTLAKRVMNQYGEETYPEENNELSIYPAQLIIPPYEKRSVKVSYNGPKTIEAEKAFRIIAEQLPIEVEKTKKKKTNVKILLRYIAALYIDNDNTQSQIELSKFETSKNDITFYVKNSGTKHQVLSNLKLRISKKNEKAFEINSVDLKNFSGENVLANQERIFKLPLNNELKKITKDHLVELKFEKDK